MRPGRGLYDALLACRYDVAPQELCASLIADVVLELEDEQISTMNLENCEKEAAESLQAGGLFVPMKPRGTELIPINCKILLDSMHNGSLPSGIFKDGEFIQTWMKRMVQKWGLVEYIRPALDVLHSAMKSLMIFAKLSLLVLSSLSLTTDAAPASNDDVSDALSSVTLTPSIAGSSSDMLVTPVTSSAPVVLSSPLPPPSSMLDTITTTAASQMPSDTVTVTEFVTEPQATITVSALITTIVETITAIPASTPTSSTPQSSPSLMWAAPPQMTDLAAFNVSAFPGGKQNLQIVKGIPANASATTAASATQPTTSAEIVAVALTTWDNSSSALRLLYPAHSIDPAKKPQGGAEFYATPIALQTASNVSFEYSVFFPANYDWVLGGKLPGLYGGHTGCSGGNSATTCFSTRLMWRPDGMGELYLYAPKAKQTKALCSDPRSVCDAAYGFSIGRGSFRYAAGGWTHLRQIVTLNTPGKQNGVFILDVNGARIINRSDVFYRDVPNPPKPPKSPQPTGVLGSLLGGLSQVLHPQDILNLKRSADSQALLPSPTAHPPNRLYSPQEPRQMPAQVAIVTTTATVTASPVIEVSPASTVTAVLFAPEDQGEIAIIESKPMAQPIGFSGIFFRRALQIVSSRNTRIADIHDSTFFGGHESKYATPRDQYAWFRGFALSCD
ncbi:hypothetical protein HWV62_10645 [Athelia sp. TMB]|nr:hypothetical protein HWV62_10645 [Athelia sp. TMB]